MFLLDLDLDGRIDELSGKIANYNKERSESERHCYDPAYLIRSFIKIVEEEYSSEEDRKKEEKEFKLGLAKHNESEIERIKDSFDLIERIIDLSEYGLKYMKEHGERKILNYAECTIEITERSVKCDQKKIREMYEYIMSSKAHDNPDLSMAKVLNNLRN